MACLVEQIKRNTQEKISELKSEIETVQNEIKEKSAQRSSDNMDGIFELAEIVSDLQGAVFEIAEIISQMRGDE